MEEFLPAQMSEEEVSKIVRLKIEDLKITDKSKIGILIGVILKETGGNADGTMVKKIVDEILN